MKNPSPNFNHFSFIPAKTTLGGRKKYIQPKKLNLCHTVTNDMKTPSSNTILLKSSGLQQPSFSNKNSAKKLFRDRCARIYRPNCGFTRELGMRFNSPKCVKFSRIVFSILPLKYLLNDGVIKMAIYSPINNNLDRLRKCSIFAPNYTAGSSTINVTCQCRLSYVFTLIYTFDVHKQRNNRTARRPSITLIQHRRLIFSTFRHLPETCKGVISSRNRSVRVLTT